MLSLKVTLLPSERFEMSELSFCSGDACRTCLVQPGVEMRFLSCLSVSGDAVVEFSHFPSESFEMSYLLGFFSGCMSNLLGTTWCGNAVLVMSECQW